MFFPTNDSDGTGRGPRNSVYALQARSCAAAAPRLYLYINFDKDMVQCCHYSLDISPCHKRPYGENNSGMNVVGVAGTVVAVAGATCRQPAKVTASVEVFQRRRAATDPHIVGLQTIFKPLD